MSAAAHIPLHEYLATVYEPDAEYVDGHIEERHVGEWLHNVVQRAILFHFFTREREWNIWAIQEQRTQVAPTKVRLPDVSVFPRSLTPEDVWTRPQLIAIEVLSPEDRQARMDERIDNYRAFGVPHIWIVDPEARAGWDVSDGNWTRRARFEVPGAEMYLDLPELFAQMDRDLS